MRLTFVLTLFPIAACVSALPGSEPDGAARVTDASADAAATEASGGARPRDAGRPPEWLRGVRSIAAGENHTCVVLDDGTVRCWGDNTFGTLGHRNVFAASTPVPVAGIADAVQIAAGGNDTCALSSSGAVRCWGQSHSGVQGIRGLEGAVAVATGGSFACAVLVDRTVRCWGQNSCGQLGDGTTVDSAVPVPVVGLAGVARIAAGTGFACAALADGSARCWGANGFGQLGGGTISECALAPVPVAGLTGVMALAANQQRACAILAPGNVACWGYLHRAEAPSPVPVAVTGIGNAVEIAVGGSHTCAALAGGVQCWGGGFLGQLGDGGRTEWTSAPRIAIPVGSGAAPIAAGTAHSCAVLIDGTVRCWGTGYLGNNNTGAGTSLLPVPVVVP